MEDAAVPLHSWFWMIVPMITVFVLSIVNFLRTRSPLSTNDDPAPGKSVKNHISERENHQ